MNVQHTFRIFYVDSSFYCSRNINSINHFLPLLSRADKVSFFTGTITLNRLIIGVV